MTKSKKRELKEKLQKYVDAGLLSKRAMRRYLLPTNELLALLDSDQEAEVVDDLNEVVNAAIRYGDRVRIN